MPIPAPRESLPLEGKLEIDSPADLVLFNYQAGYDRLDVIKTIRNGKEVFNKESILAT